MTNSVVNTVKVPNKRTFFKDLESFRLTLPEYRRHETSVYCFRSWDVVKALYLIQKLNLDPSTLDVESAAEALGINQPKGKDCNSIFCYINNNHLKKHYDTIDLTNPVILVHYSIGKGKSKEIVKTLLDGRHRLRKAYLEEVRSLPYFIINETNEKLISIR